MVARGTGNWTDSDDSSLQRIPMRRDTWLLQAGTYSVFRFKVENPGIWLLHCHMEWHIEGGLTATIIEAPEELQRSQKVIPPGMGQICNSQGIPMTGNAAGNSKDYLNLTGQNDVAMMSYGSLYPPPSS